MPRKKQKRPITRKQRRIKAKRRRRRLNRRRPRRKCTCLMCTGRYLRQMDAYIKATEDNIAFPPL